MPKKDALAPVPLLEEAWDYFRKQPVLSAVLVRLLIFPTTLSAWLNRVWEARNIAGIFDTTDLLFLAFSLVLGIVTLWGMSAILLIGKRMVTQRAGRTRTSFRRVSGDALPMVFPLLLTSLLQQCLVFYRALLFVVPAIAAFFLLLQSTDFIAPPTAPPLIIFLVLSPLLIPAIIYMLRTSFYPAILACEDKPFRAGLRGSIHLTRGRLWRVFKTLFALAALTLLPAYLLSLATMLLTPGKPVLLQYAMDIVHASLASTAFLIFLLAMIGLYGRLKADMPKMKQVKE